MPALSPRMFAGFIGVVLVATGLVALSIGISVDYDAGILGHSPTLCGTTFRPDSTLSGQLAADCSSAIGSRRMWGWPTLAVGIVAVVGAIFVRSSARPVQPT